MANIVVGGTLTGSQSTEIVTAYQGATLSTVTIVWKNRDGTAYDLTSKTVTGFYKDDAGNIYSVDGTITVTDASAGTFTVDWASTDVGTAGGYNLQFKATSGSEYDVTDPVDWYVQETFDATAVASQALVGVTTAEAAFLDLVVPDTDTPNDVIVLDASGNPEWGGVDELAGPFTISQSRVGSAAFVKWVDLTIGTNTASALSLSGQVLSIGDVFLQIAGDTMSGELVMADNLITRPVIKDYGETLNAIGSIGGGTQDIDLTLGNVVSGTVDTSTTTFTFSNPPASGTAGSFTLFLTNGGSQTVNWPASVDWAGGTAPTLTASGVDILTFTTIDGGTIWYGFAAGLDMQ